MSAAGKAQRAGVVRAVMPFGHLFLRMTEGPAGELTWALIHHGEHGEIGIVCGPVGEADMHLSAEDLSAAAACLGDLQGVRV